MEKKRFFKVKIKSFLLLHVVSSMFLSSLWGQDRNSKSAIEFSFKHKDIKIKFRPWDYVLPSETRRMDLLVGKKINGFTLYGYWKFDNRGRQWLGVRGEYDLKTFEEKLLLKFQMRVFSGVNTKSKFHYYFIPFIVLDLDPHELLRMGFLGYGKKTIGEKTRFYFGPVLLTNLADFLSIRISFGKNLLVVGTLLYLKMSFSIS